MSDSGAKLDDLKIDRSEERAGVGWRVPVVVAAIIGILLYITIRFQFRFSVSATIATFHDVLSVLSIFNILHVVVTVYLQFRNAVMKS